LGFLRKLAAFKVLVHTAYVRTAKRGLMSEDTERARLVQEKNE
jgi:hypothetical protein